MGRTEVDVVIDDGTGSARLVKQGYHLLAHGGVEGIVAAYEHDVVGVEVRDIDVLTVYLTVAIEHVLGIVGLIEKGKRHGRLAMGKALHIVGTDAIVTEETYHLVADTVAAGIGKHRGSHATTAKGNHGIEDRTSRHSAHRLVVLEYDVEHSLAYSYYFAHISYFRCKYLYFYAIIKANFRNFAHNYGI